MIELMIRVEQCLVILAAAEDSTSDADQVYSSVMRKGKQIILARVIISTLCVAILGASVGTIVMANLRGKESGDVLEARLNYDKYAAEITAWMLLAICVTLDLSIIMLISRLLAKQKKMLATGVVGFRTKN